MLVKELPALPDLAPPRISNEAPRLPEFDTDVQSHAPLGIGEFGVVSQTPFPRRYASSLPPPAALDTYPSYLGTPAPALPSHKTEYSMSLVPQSRSIELARERLPAPTEFGAVKYTNEAVPTSYTAPQYRATLNGPLEPAMLGPVKPAPLMPLPSSEMPLPPVPAPKVSLPSAPAPKMPIPPMLMSSTAPEYEPQPVHEPTPVPAPKDTHKLSFPTPLPAHAAAQEPTSESPVPTSSAAMPMPEVLDFVPPISLEAASELVQPCLIIEVRDWSTC